MQGRARSGGGRAALTFLLAGVCLATALFASAATAAGAKLVAVPAQPAPGLELRDTRGRLHRLADYRGKVVLVNFWASWCEPCREEMPSMQALEQRLQARYAAQFVVLAVNYGETEARIEEFHGRLRYRVRGEIDWTDKSVEALVERLLQQGE
jgi:thiol-disulfide isomerase/thioredoxin